jgi:uncharacterized phage protein (TIGR01671 family)
MRKRKYKAWDKYIKRFDNGNIGYIDLQQEYDVLVFDYEEDRFEMVEYIGLEDDNGKEIFEGDIIKVAGYYDGDYWMEEDNYLVVFECGSFHGKNFKWGYMDLDMSGIVIIGNMFENPELMEGINERN